jgi:hypothetical protein
MVPPARHAHGETPSPAPSPRRLTLTGGFAVIDGQQRRLHDRVRALGFADFDGYLQARCQQQARAVRQRRQARLAELGFAALEEYLQDRHVGRGWSVRRLCAEPGVGHGWMDEQLTRLGLRT